VGERVVVGIAQVDLERVHAAVRDAGGRIGEELLAGGVGGQRVEREPGELA
jgi:hypothetical protein